jgi:ABC-2 type transport system permease protein
MYNIWTIARREFTRYFSSPVAYVVAFFIFLIIGIFFYGSLSYAIQQPGYVPQGNDTLGLLAVMLMFFIPALTTRLLAEEQRLGTIELLLTAPVRDWELVVGKWLGVFMLLLTFIAITLIYPLILNGVVQPGIDKGPLISGYLGMILLCSAFAALGVFSSSLFSNQIAAFIFTMGLFVFVWWIIGPIVQIVGLTSASSNLVQYLDFNQHYTTNLIRGVIDLSDLVYFVSVTALALFLASVWIEMRRWR